MRVENHEENLPVARFPLFSSSLSVQIPSSGLEQSRGILLLFSEMDMGNDECWLLQSFAWCRCCLK